MVNYENNSEKVRLVLEMSVKGKSRASEAQSLYLMYGQEWCMTDRYN